MQYKDRSNVYGAEINIARRSVAHMTIGPSNALASSHQNERERILTAAKRLDGLDCLRGVAALFVALFHFTTFYVLQRGRHNSDLLVPMPYGFLGVDLFFILSGFVALLTTERCKSLQAFAKARTLRLWPTFLTCLSFTILLTWLMEDATPTFTQLIATVTMLPVFFGKSPIDGSYWTLGCEVVFYGLAGLSLVHFKMKAEYFCTCWLVAGIFCNTIGTTAVSGKVLYVVEPHFAPLFVLGIMANRMFFKKAGLLSWSVTLLALASIATQPVHWGHMLQIGIGEYLGMVCVALLVVYLAAANSQRVADCSALLWCGRVSYPFYLMHQSVGLSFIASLERFGLNANVAIIVSLSILLFVSKLVVRFVDQPVLRYFHQGHHSWFLAHIPPIRIWTRHKSINVIE